MVFSSQWQLVTQDRWLLASLTIIPVLLALLIWSIFAQGIARHLPIAVVDLSHSQLSRDLSHYIDASPTVAVTHRYPSIEQAKKAMVENTIYGYVVIPAKFDKNVYLALQPKISVFYNSQYILIGKLVSSAIMQAHATFNAKLGVAKSLSQGNVDLHMAFAQSVNVQMQVTPLFNKNANYSQFLLTAIIPALWQIFIVVGTILILACNARIAGIKLLLASKRELLKKLLCYSPIFLLQGLLFLWWFYQGFSWPFQGDFLVLIIAQSLTVITCMIMGAFFYFLTLDATRAMSFAGAFTAPSFAFMGITFPVTDMNLAAQIWRSLLPISHYIKVQVGQVSYGINDLTALHALTPMVGYLIPLLLTVLFFNKHRTKYGQSEITAKVSV